MTVSLPLDWGFLKWGVLKCLILQCIFDVSFDFLICFALFVGVKQPEFKSEHIQRTTLRFLNQTDTSHTCVGIWEIACDEIKDDTFPKVLQMFILLEIWQLNSVLASCLVLWVLPFWSNSCLEHLNCTNLIVS